MSGPKRQSCEKKLLMDARWSPSSLHQCSQEVSSREVQRACYQSRYCCHSPDLNLLDFHFWGEAQQQVYRKQPGNIEDLIECVKKFAAAYGSSTIRHVAVNVVKRARQWVDANSGHFQYITE